MSIKSIPMYILRACSNRLDSYCYTFIRHRFHSNCTLAYQERTLYAKYQKRIILEIRKYLDEGLSTF